MRDRDARLVDDDVVEWAGELVDAPVERVVPVEIAAAATPEDG
jgi:hypothetical protein